MRTDQSDIDNKLQRIVRGCICALSIIIIRIFYLQMYTGDTYALKGRKNFLRKKTVQSPRGNILDMNGKLLVTNRPIINLYWRKTKKKYQPEYLDKFERTISKSIIADVEPHFTRKKKHMIAADISITELSTIQELFPNHENLIIKTDFERFYPYGSYASHVLGYLGRFDLTMIGKTGLEKLFEETLKGIPGTHLHTINSVGKTLTEIELQKSLTGEDIHTTIDLEMQTIAEKIFPQEYSGTFIVMDAHTGALRALVSRPDFDPTIFLRPISSKTWNILQEKKPFLNRAFAACYPPGSLFKLVCASAALEQNLIEKTDTINCPGYLHFCKRKYWCHQRYGHGELTMHQAVAHSCNIIFFEIGKHIDVDLLAEYAHKFGLGKKTGIVFSEKKGLIPTRQWKQEIKGESWWTGETLSVAIGQSFLLVTPIQIARMIASIFTGYLVQPRILSTEPIITEPLDIQPETLQFLQETMRSVVTEGTGKRINNIKDIEIYAKTSTAQTSTFYKRKMGDKYLEHGWLVAHIQYKENNPLTLVLLLEHVGSARKATVHVKKFIIKYKKLIDNKGQEF